MNIQWWDEPKPIRHVLLYVYGDYADSEQPSLELKMDTVQAERVNKELRESEIDFRSLRWQKHSNRNHPACELGV